MSAVAGIYRLDGAPVEQKDLDRMARCLQHRGPDGRSQWLDGPVGLVHLALDTTAESRRERQPLVDRETGRVLCADVRIDNRGELIDRLESSQDPVPTDGELLLAAHGRLGEAFPEHLLGDFAGAIWDPCRRELLCIGDTLGVRPLYYHHEPGRRFAFATEIKALLALEGVSPEPDPRSIGELLMAPVEPRTGTTFYRDIRALVPAGFLRVRPDGLRSRVYWALDPEREIQLGSDEEYASRFRELIEDAVRVRLRSESRVGCLLSGGLDSSSITCQAADLLAREGRRGPATYSAVYETVTGCDERPYIQSVVGRYGLESRTWVADSVSPLVDLESALSHQDCPHPGGNVYISRMLYGLAARDGIRVIFEGYDGDTTLSHGFGHLHALAQAGRFLRLGSEVVLHARRSGQPLIGSLRPWVRRLVGVRGLGGVRRGLDRLRWVPANSPRRDVRPRWARLLSDDFLREVQPLVVAPGPLPRTEREDHHRLLSRTGIQSTLQLLDVTAGEAGLELRLPFCDRRLIEFCLALPPEQKIHRGWTRMILRRGTEGILPEDVRWRGGKSNLGPGFEYVLRTFERGRLEELRTKGTGGLDRFVDLSELSRLCAALASRSATPPEAAAVWRCLSLALWLQRRSGA